MKKQLLCFLLIGMMSQATLAGPVKPRSAKAQQTARARMNAGKPMPPPLTDRPRQ